MIFSDRANRSVEWLIASLPVKFTKRYKAALIITLLIILFSFYFLIG